MTQKEHIIRRQRLSYISNDRFGKFNEIKVHQVEREKKMEEVGQTWDKRRMEGGSKQKTSLQRREMRLCNMATWSVTSGPRGHDGMSLLAQLILCSFPFYFALPFFSLWTTPLLSSTAYGRLLSSPAVLTGKHSPGLNVADKTLTSARPT